MSPDRSGGQKTQDHIFGGAPLNLFTTDVGTGLKYQKNISDTLDRHLDVTSRALTTLSNRNLSDNQAPIYLPQAEIAINTQEIARCQRDTFNAFTNVIDSQRGLLEESNTIASQAATTAFRQRDESINLLSDILVENQTLVDSVDSVGSTIEQTSNKMRAHVEQLMTDMGTHILCLTTEQIMTRISLLQALYRIRTSFMHAHEQQMLTQQKHLLVARQQAEWTRMTDEEKEAHFEWRRSEVQRATAKSKKDYRAVLRTLAKAQKHSDIDPDIYLSLGSVHSTLGNSREASAAFAHADILLQHTPCLQSFTLMNLAKNLMKLNRFQHAECVMRRATKLDPKNREVWFLYSQSAWLAGNYQDAMAVLKTLVSLNPAYYKAQIVANSIFSDLPINYYE